MAHRRALSRPRGWVPWVLVPIALTLDGAAALGLAGLRFPFGTTIPEAVLLAAPLLVYGGLAFAVFRARPLAVRVAAAAVLLGLHAGLVVLHTLVFSTIWSLPALAALRLAHRWSPLIPLLQLVWVPLLALPLARLARPRPLAPSRRGVSPPARRDAPISRGAQAEHRGRLAPDREPGIGLGARAAAPVAAGEGMAAARLEPASSAPPLPAAPAAPPIAPTVTPPVAVAEKVSAALPLPTIAEPAPLATETRPMVLVHEIDGGIVTRVAPAPMHAGPVETEPGVASAEARVGPTAVLAPEAVASIDTVVVLTGAVPEPERPRPLEAAPVLAVPALPAPPPPAPPPVAAAPPLDPYVVARVFEPYGALLSRDGAVLVDWTPSPDAAVVCVAPPGISRERLVRLAGRVARALVVAGAPSPSPPVRRLSLRDSDGVAVLTPVDGGILVAATSRPGAAALLEVLSTRAVPGPPGDDASARGSGDARELRETRASDPVRVETPAASLDVLAPSGVDAAPVAKLAGRLLAAIAGEGAGRTLHTLSVDLQDRRLTVHPVNPHVRPPRFVAVVGGPDLPGALGRHAERAARALREVS